MRRRPSLAACSLAGSVLCASLAAQAASLQQVSSFGNNPSSLNMYVYVPDHVATLPPVVVAIHYCGGSAQALFAGPAAGLVAAANQYGYIMVFPETVSTTNNMCWDVFSNASLTHGGGSDSAGIVSMVNYTIRTYSADGTRVYAYGTSSGAMMTNVLMAAYPDVFKAGSVWSGVPDTCFAGSGFWNSACAQGQIINTGQQWGDLARAAYPGYTGYRPRVQLWHGTADATINFNNYGEEIKQWANVLGVSATPTTTEHDTPLSGYTRARYDDACGVVRVEAVSEADAGHDLTTLGSEVTRFFGLAPPGPDPGVAACSDAGTMDAVSPQDAGGDEAGSEGGAGSSGGTDGGGALSNGGGDAGGTDGSADRAGRATSGGCACALGATQGDSGAAVAFVVALLGVLSRRGARART